MNCGCCREMTLEEELNSLPIDADLKKKLISKLKQLEEDKNKLKDYLSKKGIDLEEEIGGEIVSDEDSDDNDEENDENKEDDNEEEFDFDNLGDIFGAEDEDQ